MADQATTDALIATALAAQAIKTARQALARAPVPGPDGRPGKDGQAGVDGKDGTDGKAGPAGADGRDGIDGDRGPRGERGQAGRDAGQLPRAEWSAAFTRDGTARTERITLTSPAADRRPWQITPIRDDAGLVTAAQILPID